MKLLLFLNLFEARINIIRKFYVFFRNTLYFEENIEFSNNIGPSFEIEAKFIENLALLEFLSKLKQNFIPGFVDEKKYIHMSLR